MFKKRMKVIDRGRMAQKKARAWTAASHKEILFVDFIK